MFQEMSQESPWNLWTFGVARVAPSWFSEGQGAVQKLPGGFLTVPETGCLWGLLVLDESSCHTQHCSTVRVTSPSLSLCNVQHIIDTSGDLTSKADFFYFPKMCHCHLLPSLPIWKDHANREQIIPLLRYHSSKSGEAWVIDILWLTSSCGFHGLSGSGWTGWVYQPYEARCNS